MEKNKKQKSAKKIYLPILIVNIVFALIGVKFSSQLPSLVISESDVICNTGMIIYDGSSTINEISVVNALIVLASIIISLVYLIKNFKTKSFKIWGITMTLSLLCLFPVSYLISYGEGNFRIPRPIKFTPIITKHTNEEKRINETAMTGNERYNWSAEYCDAYYSREYLYFRW